MAKKDSFKFQVIDWIYKRDLASRPAGGRHSGWQPESIMPVAAPSLGKRWPGFGFRRFQFSKKVLARLCHLGKLESAPFGSDSPAEPAISRLQSAA